MVGRKAISVAEAQSRVLAHVRPLAVEWVLLEASYGRTLAEGLVAVEPMPHFARSGVDGYAVRAADVAQATAERPVRLAVTQAVACGDMPQRPLGRGEAARIMTGAAVPVGADAVVMLEAIADSGAVAGAGAGAGAVGGVVAIARPVAAGANVTPIGGEIAPGTALLAPGSAIGPGTAALLAALGVAEPLVQARPRIAIITTGSELLEPQEPLAPGRIRNSNRAMLRGLVAAAGGNVVHAEHVPDDADLAEAAIRRGLAAADAVVTSGGVSVGDYDVVTALLQQPDRRTLLFDKVAMRPGSVTSVALQEGKLLFGLSGNPSACFVGFELFVRPALAAMQGQPVNTTATWTAKLATPFTKQANVPRYVRGRLYVRDAVLFAEPCGPDRSSATVTLKDADCLIHIPSGPSGQPEGALVEVIPLSWRGGIVGAWTP